MAGAAVLSLLGSALSGFIFNYYNLLINKHVKFPFFSSILIYFISFVVMDDKVLRSDVRSLPVGSL